MASDRKRSKYGAFVVYKIAPEQWSLLSVSSAVLIAMDVFRIFFKTLREVPENNEAEI